MAFDQITRCPQCQSVFRVASEPLVQARGWLRCGQCLEPFDSTGLTVPWSPDPEVTPERMDLKTFLIEEDCGGPSAPASANAISDDLLSFEQALASFPGPSSAEMAHSGVAQPDEANTSESTAAETPRGVMRRARAWIWAGVLLALMQLAWAWRAAWWQTPWIEETVQTWCAWMDCQVPAWRNPDLLRIDGSHFVRTDHGYQLEWTLRNLSIWPLRMAAMELILTGEDGKVLVRRVLTPDEMAAPDRLEPDQSWDGVLLVQTPDDLPVAGYRMLAFYP